eukprot:scaffold3_cov108-Isochrysis_galbana.AAC.8
MGRVSVELSLEVAQALCVVCHPRSAVKVGGVRTHLGRLEWIIRRKVDVQKEDAPVIRRILLLTHTARAHVSKHGLAVRGVPAASGRQRHIPAP